MVAEIEKATKEDEESQELIKWLRKPASKRNSKRLRELEPCEKVINEMTITNEGIVLRNHRLVIPKTLRDRVVSLAHIGHQGIVKTKAMILKSLVSWHRSEPK